MEYTDCVDYCIYHRKCVDGICSAWIIKNIFPNVNMIECGAGEKVCEHIEINSFCQKNIIFVDVCSPCENELIEISNIAKEITIIDHHITTNEMVTLLKSQNYLKNIKFIFDEMKAGCQLTWEYFCKIEKCPWFLNYVADRDLWKITMPYSKEINMNIHLIFI